MIENKQIPDSAIHFKATLDEIQEFSLPSLRSVITMDDAHRFNVDFDHFDFYIQEVMSPVIVRKVVQLYDEKAFTEAQKWVRNNFLDENVEIPILFDQKEGISTKYLEDFEEREGLNHLHKHEDVQHFPWSIINYFEVIKKKGFYTKDAGYQWGIVSQSFQERFGNNLRDCFAHKEDFQFVYRCIDATPPYNSWEDIEVRRKNFRENFLENFEPGVSFLLIE